MHKHSQVDVVLQPFERVGSGVAAPATPALASLQWGRLGDGGWCLAVWGKPMAALAAACGYLPEKEKEKERCFQ